MEAIQVACQKQWVLKLVLSKQRTWRRCGGNLETPLVRKLLTFFTCQHIAAFGNGHCMMWPLILVLHGDSSWSCGISGLWHWLSPCSAGSGSFPVQVIGFLSWPSWRTASSGDAQSWQLFRLAWPPCSWWRPWPTKMWANFHEGSNPWSATSLAHTTWTSLWLLALGVLLLAKHIPWLSVLVVGKHKVLGFGKHTVLAWY
jgi:hypothetical protein